MGGLDCRAGSATGQKLVCIFAATLEIVWKRDKLHLYGCKVDVTRMCEKHEKVP